MSLGDTQWEWARQTLRHGTPPPTPRHCLLTLSNASFPQSPLVDSSLVDCRWHIRPQMHVGWTGPGASAGVAGWALLRDISPCQPHSIDPVASLSSVSHLCYISYQSRLHRCICIRSSMVAGRMHTIFLESRRFDQLVWKCKFDLCTYRMRYAAAAAQDFRNWPISPIV